MAFDFHILNSKKIVDGKIDLLSNYLYINYENVIIDDWILVDDQSAMLLDLISYAKYGTVNYSDILKKFNRIDNPLEISQGFIIAIPNLQSLSANSVIVDLTNRQQNLSQKFSQTQLNDILRTPTKKPTPSSNFTRAENGNFIF